MKTQSWKNPLVWFLMLLLSGCVEPYFPEVLESQNTFLVVNGFLNANGPTTIQLLRTQNLNENGPSPAESQAKVTVESEGGEQYSLFETGNGVYMSHNMQLAPEKKYRLLIRTIRGKEYASDFVEVKKTPAIDNITWKPVNDEVQVLVNTHDDSNNTRYYRWEYEQTWQFRAALYSTIKYENGAISQRGPNDNPIYNCWKSENSTTIELGSSIKLNSDVISNYKLLTLPQKSDKIAIKNSILVKQYALSREAYEYWETLKKNTESIGTLFDPLPSQLTSNIRSLSDPNEPVIGFLTAATMQQKRIFIDSKDLPAEWRLYYPSCPVDTVMISSGQVNERFEGGGVLPVEEVYGVSPSPIGYTYAPRSCVDCTLRGTNVKPAFWE